jgi:tetratricopeptide (TPR) repeat protein
LDTPENLLTRGYEARRQGHFAHALQCFARALDLCDDTNQQLLAKALTALGQAERDLQHHDVAIEYYQRAADIYRRSGDALRLAHTIRHVGDILRNTKQLSRAKPCYEEALEIYRANTASPPLDVANALRGCALLDEDLGDHDAAATLWCEARDLYAAVNVQAGVEECESRLKRYSTGA